MTLEEQTRLVRSLALGIGFDEVGMARLEDLTGGVEERRYRSWLEEGRQGTMTYMAGNPERRLDSSRSLPGARSIICVALSYWDPETPGEPGEGRGRVARYARGRDYHKVMDRKLRELAGQLEASFPGMRSRRYVDTGPVLEKLWAERAGLGWRGKHTNLVSRAQGSWLLLGELLVDLELVPDSSETDHCGTCSRCIEACPTGAITGPYQLDARLCISYLTIEHRGSIPRELRPGLGDHLFGCDDCLDVCPWNRFSRAATEADFRPRPEVVAPLLGELLDLDDEGFTERFAGTPVMRAKREGLVRNACVVLGNTRGEEAVPSLGRALGDPSPVVREHAAWALGRIGGSPAEVLLQGAVGTESDETVLESLRDALVAGRLA